MKQKFQKQFNNFTNLLLLLGVVTFLFLIIVNEKLLSLFTIDNDISDYYSGIISSSQYLIIIFSSVFFILFCLLKYGIIRIQDKHIDIYLSIIFMLYIIFLGEVSIRFIEPIKNKIWLLKHSLLYEPSSFSVHRFAKNQIVHDENSDSVRVVINNGFRGQTFSIDKPKNEIRIVILGGSFVFNWNQKGIDKDWPHLVENELIKKGYSNIKVINAGTPSHTSLDALGRLYSEIHYLNPDYIMLCNAWNDIKYFRNISPNNNPFRTSRPLTIPTISELSYHSFWQKFIDNFHLYKAMNLILNSLDEKEYGFEGRINNYDPLEAYPDTFSSYAIKQYQLNINIFIDICKNINAIPILIVQPRLISPNNSKEEKNKINYRFSGLSHEGLVTAFYKCDSVLNDISKNRSIDLIDLHSKFSGENDYFDDHVHLTPIGSKMVANEVAESLQQIIRN